MPQAKSAESKQQRNAKPSSYQPTEDLFPENLWPKVLHEFELAQLLGSRKPLILALTSDAGNDKALLSHCGASKFQSKVPGTATTEAGLTDIKNNVLVFHPNYTTHSAQRVTAIDRFH